MAMLDGELRRTESQFVRVYRPGGYEQVAVGRLQIDPGEPTGGISLEPNRNIPSGEYLLTSMGYSRQWPVILRRAEGTTLEVLRFPAQGAGRR